MNDNPALNINGVDIQWCLEKGTFNFFGLPSALFWLNPSLLTMLQPLADEVGHDLFRLEVAASASLGTKEDYHAMITVLADTFEEGFLKWGRAVSSAGWGTFELSFFDMKTQRAKVRVSNTWELIMQSDLETPWGCPFIQGKIIGIFNHALNTNCWADEITVSYDSENPYVEFDIYESSKTVQDEIRKERFSRMQDKERNLTLEVEKKTAALQTINQELKDSLVALKQAKEVSEHASQVKTVFLSSMSHELRTPLNSILGFSQLLEQTSTEISANEIVDYANEIKISGNTMLTLIEKMFKYTEFESGKTSLSICDIDVKDAIESTFQLHVPDAKLKNIDLINNITYETLPNVISDSKIIQDILSIFLGNAIKYIPSGRQITINADLINNTEKHFLRIAITDNGDGITEDKQANTFKLFERLDQVTGTVSGTGIGLAFAKKMANKVSAEIDFESKVNEGSTFWLDLPVVLEIKSNTHTH